MSTTIRYPQTKRCGYCDGTGFTKGWYGIEHCPEPDDCRPCGGTGRQLRRAPNGRFLPWIVVEVETLGEES